MVQGSYQNHDGEAFGNGETPATSGAPAESLPKHHLDPVGEVGGGCDAASETGLLRQRIVKV